MNSVELLKNGLYAPVAATTESDGLEAFWDAFLSPISAFNLTFLGGVAVWMPGSQAEKLIKLIKLRKKEKTVFMVLIKLWKVAPMRTEMSRVIP